MKATSKVSGSGPTQTGVKTAIPAEVRDYLDLKKGDILIWESIARGELKLRKI